MTPQEKIDEIHTILVKWERRRKWASAFSWLYRLIIIGCILMLVFFPNVITELGQRMLTPIIDSMTQTILDSQKEKISTFTQNLHEKAQNLLP